MDILIIYDVSANQTPVKDGLKQKGYNEKWTSNQKTYYLPETSVWKKNITTAEALKDIQDVINSVSASKGNTRLERCIVLHATPWDGIEGVPFKT